MDNMSKILIAEDDLVVARLQKFSLEKVIFGSPVMCKDGKEAMDYLDSIAGDIEQVLVLLDLNMPVMNGRDFLNACRERSYSEKVQVVIVTSSHFQEDQKKAAAYEQVIGYYTKPITGKNIQEILNLPEVAGVFDLLFKRE